MKRKSFMLIAGETSGDTLAAELVEALRGEFEAGTAPFTWDYQPLYGSFEPRFFGAGGSQMAAAGVELAFDMTAHSVTGISDVLKNYPKFRRLFKQLYELALSSEPDAIICVDFSGFNRRFAHAVRQYVRSHLDWFHDWNPKIIQYVSPQVWASRESRAYQMATDFDLVLSIFPFERDWYAARAPKLRVEFVGHPMIDRYKSLERGTQDQSGVVLKSPTVLLLPGSRPDELVRHLPVLLGAMDKMRAEFPQVRAQMVLPNEALVKQATEIGMPQNVQVQVGGLAEALRHADLAIASTGTVTLECAYFGVPTVALYRTSWVTWQIAKRIVTVKYAAMPNLLANEEVFPEFIQDAATVQNIGRAAIELLRDEGRRRRIKEQLAGIVASLGTPGAAQRAARAVMETLGVLAGREPAQCDATR
jgi:lipid-A-disaccharide synthase